MASEGTFIDQTQAKAMRNAYEASNSYTSNGGQKAILFGSDKIEEILSQPTCAGIRIYYGKATKDNVVESNLVLVGVDSAGNDMLNKILDLGSPCPSNCPKNPW